MKSIKSILAGACLIGATSLAHASFSYTLTGPSSVDVGQTGSFNFHVSYTPFDFGSLDPHNGWAEYSRESAFDYEFLRVDAAAGASFVSGVTMQSGMVLLDPLLGRPAGVVSDFDVNLPFQRDLSFSMSFANTGNFGVRVNTLFQEYVLRKPSALCLSDPACTVDIQEMINDSYRFEGTSTSSMTVTVSAVPEPSTYALMLAGLGVIVALVRRRRGAV